MAKKENAKDEGGKKVTVVLVLAYPCQNSVRYNAIDDATKQLLTSVYLMNEAYQYLNKPDKIVVEVKVGE